MDASVSGLSAALGSTRIASICTMPDDNAELRYEEFVPARKAYWQSGVKHFGDSAPSRTFERTSLVRDGSDFILYSAGPSGIFAVFEDFAQSGWFYLYDSAHKKIIRSAYVYCRADVAIEEDVIDIGWASDDSACGLAVWGEFRAFLGIRNDVQKEKPVKNADDPGIPSSQWPAGFELYLEKQTD
jgi:hypothetical protein